MSAAKVLDATYRYTLRREWAFGGGCVCWVMLNPSTADALVDDPTIRRVIRFSQDAGYQSLVVVNLFAARTTRPVHLTEMFDPVGPDNRDLMAAAISEAQGVVLAWGSWLSANLHKVATPANAALYALRSGHVPMCLGTTSDGSPRHPLYVRADQPLVPFGVAA